MQDHSASCETHRADHSALLQNLTQALQALGLLLRGGFNPQAEDSLPLLPSGRSVGSVLMVGNAGPGMWRVFSASRESADGQAHSLNRWTLRQVDAIALAVGGAALYPFNAAPVWPFQRWAARAEAVAPSPLGLFIHPEYGLWHAYRAAVLIAPKLDFPPLEANPSPCLSCAGQPCLNSCPVGAFSRNGYDVPACARHLGTPAGQDCLGGGCVARRACPVGTGYVQSPAQNSFHMDAFFKAVQGW